MDQLQELFKHVLDKGYKKADRTGVGTISTFGYQCRFDLKEGFPIVTTKKTAFKAAVTELIWMIGGWMKDPTYKGIQRTNIKFLLDNNCHIWTEWPYKAYKQYVNDFLTGSTIPGNYVMPNELLTSVNDPFSQLPYRAFTQLEFEHSIMTDHDFAVRFGDLGPVYQKQWREFEGKKNQVDQLMQMVERLKSNPDDRRNLTSFWNPTELNEMLLPPCHLLHQVWTRELSYNERFNLLVKNNLPDYTTHHDRIEEELDKNNVIPRRAVSLQMYQRSSDCFLGVPFDWVFYGLLTHMLAEITNMAVDELIWVSGDTHLYLNSIEEAKTVLTREPYPYPKLLIKRKVYSLEDYKIDDFKLDNYKFHDAIKVAVAV